MKQASYRKHRKIYGEINRENRLEERHRRQHNKLAMKDRGVQEEGKVNKTSQNRWGKNWGRKCKVGQDMRKRLQNKTRDNKLMQPSLHQDQDQSSHIPVCTGYVCFTQKTSTSSFLVVTPFFSNSSNKWKTVQMTVSSPDVINHTFSHSSESIGNQK